MADLETFTNRLREAIGDTPVARVASKAGIGEASVRQYLNGSVPGADKVVALSEALGVDLVWLLTGKGQAHDRASQPSSADDQFAFIPRLDIQAAAGSGSLALHEEAVDFLAFRSEWLRKVGINPAAARVLTAKGDSMEPTIRDGDILLLDTSINRIIDNAIYVVVYSGLVLLKRVQVKLDGSVVLSSDNTAVYDPEIVQPSEVDSLHIAARLMWFGRSI